MQEDEGAEVEGQHHQGGQPQSDVDREENERFQG
jgi:peptide subunit release factor 1 (eRF1)